MAAQEVKIISTTTVLAASTLKDSLETINLTPYDLRLLLVDPIQKGLLYTGPYDQDSTTLVSHLKASLSTTLTFFPRLTGRFTAIPNEDGTVSYRISCNNHGVILVHAKVEGLKVEDIMQSAYVPAVVYDFFTLNGTQNCDGTTFPFLGVQVTELNDGVFIGCTMNHAVADGTSFWHFFNSWAEISRGVGGLSKPPVFESKFLSDLSSDIQVRVQYEKKQQVSNNNIRERVYHFSKENIAKIKSRANYEVKEASISSLQAILAHLWRAIIRNTKNLDLDIDLTCRLPIGLRQRMNTYLHENYFGNAIQPGVLTIKARELVDSGLGHAALQLNKMVSSNTEETCMAFLKSWIENPQLVRFGSSQASRSVHATLVINNSPRFDAYGNDFGWGRPIAARSGMAWKGACGIVTVYHAKDEGSMDIEVCVLAETLEAMENDREFMEDFTSDHS